MFEGIQLPVYIINLPERKERLAAVLQEFEGKAEFELIVLEAEKRTPGAAGLWCSMQKAVKLGMERDDDLIIICEDDHQFTPAYQRDGFFRNIIEANHQGCDILCGGISGGFSRVLPLTRNRFLVDAYWCNQFIVIYRRFFEKMLSHPFDISKKVDNTLSLLSDKKMVLYPFISVQRTYGYSDVTPYNNDHPEWMESRFRAAESGLGKVLAELDARAGR